MKKNHENEKITQKITRKQTKLRKKMKRLILQRSHFYDKGEQATKRYFILQLNL